MDDNVLVEVLLAAKRAGTLAQLSSISKQLCSLARSRVPVRLQVLNQQQAGLVIRSHVHGRAPFSGCKWLRVAAGDLDRHRLARGVLSAAQQWTGLERLSLSIAKEFSWPQQQQQQQQQQQVDGPTLELWTSNLLVDVAALRQLRELVLDAPSLGTGSAQHIMQLTQLTSMQLIAQGDAGEAVADLGALSAMTNLVELKLHCNLAPYLPTPYCLPSSLTSLLLDNKGQDGPVSMTLWVAHLSGCHALQRLQLFFSDQGQHGSTHPNVVVRVLAQHCRQLRTLCIRGTPWHWGAFADGLWEENDAPEDEHEPWRPDASLAALTGLQSIDSPLLTIDQQEDWQHMAHLTALTSLCMVAFHYAPPLDSGMSLAALKLDECHSHLTGHQLGRLLLACPSLKEATLHISDGVDDASQAPGPPLPPHPTLSFLALEECSGWGGWVGAAAAVAQFAALAPVLGRMSSLSLAGWPAPISRKAVALPDLSPCTALTGLQFEWIGHYGNPPAPYPEDLLSMVAPLVQLYRLEVRQAPWLNARVALVLQSMLPQLRQLDLACCGSLSAACQQWSEEEDEWEEGDDPEEEEEQLVLRKVHSLLRPSLQLRVT